MSRFDSLPAALAAELIARGWTASEASRRAGLPRNAVGKILSGETPNPGIRTLAAILRALGKPWAWVDGV